MIRKILFVILGLILHFSTCSSYDADMWCYKEVPAVETFVKIVQTPKSESGNSLDTIFNVFWGQKEEPTQREEIESRQTTKTIRFCCEGFVQAGSSCKPQCGVCPDYSSCTAPHECTCLDGYSKKDGVCVKQCELTVDGCQPVCSKGCPAYSKCISLENCACNDGYDWNAGICEPICKPNCGKHSTCLAPNECQCQEGYQNLGDKIYEDCVPKCIGCEHGDCVAPGKCICSEGYALNNDTGTVGIEACIALTHSLHVDKPYTTEYTPSDSTEYTFTEYTSTDYTSSNDTTTDYTSSDYSSTDYSESTEYSSTEYSSTEYTSTEYSSTEYTSTDYTDSSSTESSDLFSTLDSSTESITVESAFDTNPNLNIGTERKLQENYACNARCQCWLRNETIESVPSQTACLNICQNSSTTACINLRHCVCDSQNLLLSCIDKLSVENIFANYYCHNPLNATASNSKVGSANKTGSSLWVIAVIVALMVVTALIAIMAYSYYLDKKYSGVYKVKFDYASLEMAEKRENVILM